MRCILGAPLLILLVAVNASAQDAKTRLPSSMAELLDCRALVDPQVRLACYDRASNAVNSAIEADRLLIVDDNAIKQTRRTLFGLRLPKISLFGNDDKDEIESISSPIARIDKLPFSRFRLTLEDGSVWETMETQKSLYPKPGATVLVERAAITGYRAEVGSKKGIRVVRVR